MSAGIFTVAIAAIMADLTALSTSGRLEIGLTTLVAVVAVVLFVLQERRSPEPMISLELWGRRPIAAANGASLLAGMVMIGLTTFLPVFVQGVMQKSPLIGGFALSAMVLGWPIGATVGVRAASGALACAPCCGSAACSFRWARSFSSSSTGRVRPSWPALARSSSASAWAFPAAPRSS